MPYQHYNAMPEEGVDQLIEFMADFERRYSQQ